MSRRRSGEPRDGGDLKKENEALKRQVARLRKQVERLDETPDDEEPVLVEEAPKPKCPKCKSVDLGEIETPAGKTVTSCKSCKKWRSKPT